MMYLELNNKLHRLKSHIENLMADHLLIPERDHGQLANAMRYSVLAPAKRIRPALVYLTGELFNSPVPPLDAPALALEYIHTYSLIHDDLPCMDDDAMRRGQPSCHIQFDEATAVLAGDTLQSLAFKLLSAPSQSLTGEQQLNLIHILSDAIGYNGMAGGQALDLELNGCQSSLQQLTALHDLKTAKLIQASILMGAVASGCTQEKLFHALSKFGSILGLLFQIRDDILDADASETVMGKPVGSDIKNNKSTFATIMSREKLQAYTQDITQNALDALKPFGDKAYYLKQLPHFLLERSC